MKVKKDDNKAEKRSVSMPKWLWRAIEQSADGETVSATLQALAKKALKIKK